MNPVVILDTSAVIRLFKGTSREIGRAVMNSRNLIIPLAAYAEFLAGVERGGRTAQRERELMENLLEEPGSLLILVQSTASSDIPSAVSTIMKMTL